MSCSEWINLAILIVALSALAAALIQPRIARCREKKEIADRVKKRGSLYLDVFEIKVKQELNTIATGGIPLVNTERFEKKNLTNYDALEKILQEASVLEHDAYMELMEFVRHFKTSPNMKNENDLKDFLARLKDKNLRAVFPEGRGLQEAIRKVSIRTD